MIFKGTNKLGVNFCINTKNISTVSLSQETGPLNTLELCLWINGTKIIIERDNYLTDKSKQEAIELYNNIISAMESGK